ncbi:MAG: Mpo1-like protein [Kofleriaceae bacterium]
MRDEMYAAKTFEEFWHHYDELHAYPSVRIAHAVGTASALLLMVRALMRRDPRLAIAAPIVDHVIAQLSHRVQGERTRPLQRPLWHARAEWRLFRRTVRSLVRGRRGRREVIDVDAYLSDEHPVDAGAPHL